MLRYNIIPKPNSYETREGTYAVSSGTEILCPREFVTAGNYLTDYLRTRPEPGEGSVKFQKTDGMGEEAYSLEVGQDGVFIQASSLKGAFYGAVTLKLILMQAQKEGGRAIVSCLRIEDAPLYGYRGAMLDESRHFFGMQTVKKLLDNMALLKLNVFHWHLSDDQGFRIESKVFPKLNSVGSRREFAGLQGCGLKHRGGEYFHYYTQDEIRGIVAYAKKLQISIMPEIDLPGHASAILAAYPELACEPQEFKPLCESGIFGGAVCPGSDRTAEFLDKLFAELCPLFDFRYFHIGGDEAIMGHKVWARCPKCVALKKENHLKNEKELQGLFMTRLSETLKKYGKTAVVWNDCINDSISEDVVCQYWVMTNSFEVKKQSYKRDVLLSPNSHFYFDLKYAWTPLRRTYGFSAARAGFGKPGQRVIGLECENWTEWVDSPEALEFGLYPRIAAFAEVCWTEKANKRYGDFLKRLEWYKTYLRKKNINYSRLAGREPISKGKTVFHLGADGSEYKLNEKLKAKEN